MGEGSESIKAEPAKFQSYYDRLGVPTTAPAEGIKKAFREKAKQFHTDLGGDKEKMQELNEANDVLKDSAKRDEYDKALPGLEAKWQREHGGNSVPPNRTVVYEPVPPGWWGGWVAGVNKVNKRAEDAQREALNRIAREASNAEAKKTTEKLQRESEEVAAINRAKQEARDAAFQVEVMGVEQKVETTTQEAGKMEAGRLAGLIYDSEKRDLVTKILDSAVANAKKLFNGQDLVRTELLEALERAKDNYWGVEVIVNSDKYGLRREWKRQHPKASNSEVGDWVDETAYFLLDVAAALRCHAISGGEDFKDRLEISKSGVRGIYKERGQARQGIDDAENKVYGNHRYSYSSEGLINGLDLDGKYKDGFVGEWNRVKIEAQSKGDRKESWWIK